MGENNILVLVEFFVPFRTDEPLVPSHLNAEFSMGALPLLNTVMFYVIAKNRGI